VSQGTLSAWLLGNYGRRRKGGEGEGGREWGREGRGERGGEGSSNIFIRP